MKTKQSLGWKDVFEAGKIIGMCIAVVMLVTSGQAIPMNPLSPMGNKLFVIVTLGILGTIIAIPGIKEQNRIEALEKMSKEKRE